MEDPCEHYYPTSAIVYLSKTLITKIHSMGLRKQESHCIPLHRDLNLTVVHDLRDQVHGTGRPRKLVRLWTCSWCPVWEAQ